jgi:plastocyanin domain-containing protein
MAAQDSGLPYKEKEECITSPSNEVNTKSALNHSNYSSDGWCQEKDQEIQQIIPVETAIQTICQGATCAF